MVHLGEFVSEATILPALRDSTLRAVLGEMVAVLVRSGAVAGKGSELLAGLEQREEIMSTGLGGGIAIPHAWAHDVTRVAIAVGRSAGGVDYRALDGNPVHIVFLLASPEEDPWRHLQILARISGLLRTPGVKDGILGAPDAREIHAQIVRHDR
ncbi:MAG: PTS sugar transporter subunit IIA [Acidobacteriota bacterium]